MVGQRRLLKPPYDGHMSCSAFRNSHSWVVRLKHTNTLQALASMPGPARVFPPWTHAWAKDHIKHTVTEEFCENQKHGSLETVRQIRPLTLAEKQVWKIVLPRWAKPGVEATIPTTVHEDAPSEPTEVEARLARGVWDGPMCAPWCVNGPILIAMPCGTHASIRQGSEDTLPWCNTTAGLCKRSVLE